MVKLQELTEFYGNLKVYKDILTNPESLYVVEDGPEILRFLRKTSIQKQKDEAIDKFRQELVRKAGKYKDTIIELTGKQFFTQAGFTREIWSEGLKSNVYLPITIPILDLCIDATNEAIGKLEIEEKTKDKQLMNKNVEGKSMTKNKSNWDDIESQFGINKNQFGRKINFVSDKFKRKIIFRDVEDAFVLASQGFSKPAVILAGGIIEELLRLYLIYQNIPPIADTFDGYIKTCEQQHLLKNSVSRLSDSVRQFRNLVHIEAEKTSKHSISKATAVGAVSSIFTIANDF